MINIFQFLIGDFGIREDFLVLPNFNDLIGLFSGIFNAITGFTFQEP